MLKIRVRRYDFHLAKRWVDWKAHFCKVLKLMCGLKAFVAEGTPGGSHSLTHPQG